MKPRENTKPTPLLKIFQESPSIFAYMAIFVGKVTPSRWPPGDPKLPEANEADLVLPGRAKVEAGWYGEIGGTSTYHGRLLLGDTLEFTTSKPKPPINTITWYMNQFNHILDDIP